MPESDSKKPVQGTNDSLQQTAQKETAAPFLRRYRSALFKSALVFAVMAFALLTFVVKTTPSLSIDLQITHAVQSIDSSFFAASMELISWPGFFPQSLIITLIIAFGFYMYGLYWESITCLLAAFLSGVTNQLVKNIIQRPRPALDIVDVFAVLDSYSFPSAHVMFYSILFGFVGYVVYTLFQPSLLRSVLLSLCSTLILFVGLSRIHLGQHWASDVLGAYLLGGLILAGVILLYQWGKTRFFLHQPVAPPPSNEK